MAFAVAYLSGMGSALADDWQARWIGPAAEAQADRRNSWYCFRKTLTVDKVPSEFPVKIACDSKYWLWVNGKQTVLEGGLKRGPTPTGTYFDTVDLAPFLQVGDNTIAILLWHFGKHGFSHNDSGKVGLIVDSSKGKLSLRTDSTWRVRRHPAFEDANDPPPNYRLPEGNIRFDARKTISNWQTRESVNHWPPAVEYGRPPCRPWGELIERPILQWKDYGIRDYVSTVETTTDQLYKRSRLRNPERIKQAIAKTQYGKQEDHRRVLVGILPYNCHVHPYLSITARAGLKIDIQTDLLTDGRNGFLRAEYVTREGPQEFECLGWMNGHEVRYFLPEEVTVHSIKYRGTGYNAEFVGSFRCDNSRLNTLWEKARRTLYVTMRDTYMDCPDRERAQWWGDAVNEIGEAFYVFDAANGPLLARKAILELAAFQRSDKTLYSPVPAGIPTSNTRDNLRNGSWSRELPRQMLASVGYYGFWTYYLYTGDKETMRTVYPAVRDYLSVWEQDESGLVKHRTGEWDWTDWGQNKDVAVLENAWFHLALRGAMEMANLLGEREDARQYREQMDRIEAEFNRTFWQGQFYRSPSHNGETDDRANALAVVAGLASSGDYSAITKFLQANMHASPYMEKYVLEAFFLMDEPDAGMERMLRRYASMINCPETTLWENFARPGRDEPGSGTYNHAWSGGPLTIMHQYIAGIEPTAPGFKRFSVKPQLGPLNSVETTVPTPYGKIVFAAKRRESGELAIRLVVPEDTTADVEIGDRKKTFTGGTHSCSTQRRTSIVDPQTTHVDRE
jgi:hypothetical protein